MMNDGIQSGGLPAGTANKYPAGRSGLASRIRNYFLTGLVVAGPGAVTLWLVWWFVTWVDNLVRPVIPLAYRPETYLPINIPGFGLIIAFVALTLLGFLTANLVGSSVVSFGEGVLNRMPIVRPIYRTTKQIFQTLFSSSEFEFPARRARRVSGARDVVARLPHPAAEPAHRSASAADRAYFGVSAVYAQPDHRLFLLCPPRRRDRSRHYG